MGYSVEELSSSQSVSFQLHSVVQSCCAGRCCSDNLVTQKIPCHYCDEAEDHVNTDDDPDIEITKEDCGIEIKVCQRYGSTINE